MAIYKSLNKALCDIENATTLKLKVKSGVIPKDLLKLENLEQLFIQSDGMNQLDCSNIPTSLKSLNIKDPGLEKISASLLDLSNLKILNLSSCNIKDFLIDLMKGSKIESLNLSKNNLVEMPQNFEFFSGLKMLTLSNNNLVTIPPKLLLLERLENLDIISNMLTCIDIDLYKLTKLKSLCLDKNNFSEEEKQRITQRYHISFEAIE